MAGEPDKIEESNNKWVPEPASTTTATTGICHVLELLVVRGNLYAFPTDVKLMFYLCSKTMHYMFYTISYIVFAVCEICNCYFTSFLTQFLTFLHFTNYV